MTAAANLPADPPARRPGAARFGRYLLGAKLGSGAAATVYLARLPGPHGFGRLLALKIIHEHLVDQKEFRDLFLEEARLAVRLAHPGIVHVYELGVADERLFLAMEYLNGHPLSSVCARAMERGVRIAPDLVAWAGARAAEALHHAHEATDESGARLGLVHRDVSPQNLFVTYDGQVKVIDFGIARAEGRLVQTGHGKIRGKFRYMAPEQLLGRDVDRRADLFALGATLYEAAVGQPVFAGGEETDVLQALLLGEVPDPRVRAPDVPPALSRLLLRALAGDPADRPQTGAELARELDAVAAASGRTDQQARIAALLGEMFVEEREQRAHAIAQLREPAANEGDPGSVLRLAAPPAADGAENTVLLTTLRPRASRLGQVALAAAVLVALASAAFVLASRVRHAPTAAAPPVAQSIALDVRVQPPVEATIRIGGRVVDQRPAREMLARATAPVQIEVTAPG